MDPAAFLTELKRRKVYRVAVAYAIVVWLLIQAASILFPTFEAPPWVMEVFVSAVILGFPVALILAWAFELTPKGIRRSEEAAPRGSKTPKAGSKWTAIDTVNGATVQGFFALIYARNGDADRAIELVERLLTTPFAVDYADDSITVSDLRQRWEWDPLRSDPRFQKILAGPEPKTVYK